MFKLHLEKADEPKVKLPTSAGSSQKLVISGKTSISAGQEAIVTIGHGTTDWF